MTNQAAQIELNDISETLNRIQALATALSNMVAPESSAAYLVQMIEELASDAGARTRLGELLVPVA